MQATVSPKHRPKVRWFKSGARNHEYYTMQDIFWIDLIS